MQNSIIKKTNLGLDLISKEEVSAPNLNNENEKVFQISYVSDIHLETRFRVNKCQNSEDMIDVFKNIRKNFFEAKNVILIAGDTVDSPDLFEFFSEICGLFKIDLCLLLLETTNFLVFTNQTYNK